MRTLLSVTVLSLLLLTPAATAGADISFGIRIGAPPAPRAYRVPVQPGPGYVWVEGYWYPQGSHYRWHDGYWTLPPSPGAYWVQPYYTNGRYYSGYWEDGRRWAWHNHNSDRYQRRDDRRNTWHAYRR